MEKKPTILYVDDERYNLSTFTAAFRRHYNILTAISAREALELLRNNTIDLIITDQRMPEMTGVQFLEAVIPEFPDPSRMILTAFSDIEAITKAINTGAVLRYITKPWHAHELKQILDMGIKINQLEKNSKLLLADLSRELSNQRETLDRFCKYVPENVNIDTLLEQENNSFEGEYRIISTLFSDIRQFTRLSEELPPKVLVTYLNQYFALMVDCVVKNHGTIYKLVGDGIWAIFGWPVSTLFNQRNAVFAAQDMIAALATFNRSFGVEIDHKTTIGIGISTGEAIVGQIQTDSFTSSVVVGESVDMACYIEDKTHDQPDTILINEVTYQAVKLDVEVESITATDSQGHPLYKVLGKKQT